MAAVVMGLVLITAAACGGDDDDSPPDGAVDNTFDEEVELTDEQQDAQDKIDTQRYVDQFLTGHIVTLPDGSTVRCVVSSRDGDELECEF